MALRLEDLHDEFYVLLESVAFDLGRKQDELGFLIRVRLQRTQKRSADLQKPHNKKYSSAIGLRMQFYCAPPWKRGPVHVRGK